MLKAVICLDDPGPLTTGLRGRVKDVRFVEAAGVGQLAERIVEADVPITTGVGPPPLIWPSAGNRGL